MSKRNHAARPLRRLGAGTVHIWVNGVQWSRVREMARLIGHAERRIGRTFKCAETRRQYVLTRGMVRHLLPMYSGGRSCQPVYVHGRSPRVHPSALRITMSLAHSTGTVAVAFGRIRPIGVDVETVPRSERLCEGVRRFLGLPNSTGDDRLWLSWCRGEALAKATGEGLNNRLARELCNPRRELVVSAASGSWAVCSPSRPRRQSALACATEGQRIRAQVRDFPRLGSVHG
jgi:phosphopantetheinyl transferase